MSSLGYQNSPNKTDTEHGIFPGSPQVRLLVVSSNLTQFYDFDSSLFDLI